MRGQDKKSALHFVSAAIASCDIALHFLRVSFSSGESLLIAELIAPLFAVSVEVAGAWA